MASKCPGFNRRPIHAAKDSSLRRKKGEQSCKPEVKELIIQIGSWSHLGNGSGNVSPIEVNLFSWELNQCFPLKGQVFPQPSLVKLFQLCQAFSILVGQRHKKISPWERTVCSSANSSTRRLLKGQKHSVGSSFSWCQTSRLKNIASHQPGLFSPTFPWSKDVSLYTLVSHCPLACHVSIGMVTQPRAPARPGCR